jgi:membrane-associated phospholipid phosphatase
MNLIIVFAAKYLILLSVIVFLSYGFAMKVKAPFIKSAATTAALALVLGLAVGALHYNVRPFMVPGAPAVLIDNPPTYNGFPSGHALFTGTLAAIVSPYNPYVGGALWLIALMVGVARVLAGVHHTIDIIASYGIAVSSAAIIHYARKRSAIRRGYLPRP